MKRIKITDNFYLDEFVDIHTYLTSLDHGLSKIDKPLFDIAQKVREYYNKPIFINTWWKYYKDNETKLTCNEIIEKVENSSTVRKWSGLRTERCNIGSSQSSHNLGKAIDIVGDEMLLYSIVEENAEEFYNIGVRRLEEPLITKGWLHIDTLERNTKLNSIRVVDLTKATRIIKW